MTKRKCPKGDACDDLCDERCSALGSIAQRARDDTDLAALRAEVERVIGDLENEGLDYGVVLLRRLLDRLARAEAERDAARAVVEQRSKPNVIQGMMRIGTLIDEAEAAVRQRDAAERALKNVADHAEVAIMLMIGRGRHGGQHPVSTNAERTGMVALDYIAEQRAAWRAARETQA